MQTFSIASLCCFLQGFSSSGCKHATHTRTEACKHACTQVLMHTHDFPGAHVSRASGSKPLTEVLSACTEAALSLIQPSPMASAFPAGLCSPVSCQNIHECGLPSSRRTHDGHQLSAVEFSRDPFQKGLVSCKNADWIHFSNCCMLYLTSVLNCWGQRHNLPRRGYERLTVTF